MNDYDFRKEMERKFINECPDEPYLKAIEFGEEAVKGLVEYRKSLRKQGLAEIEITHLSSIKQEKMLAAKL